MAGGVGLSGHPRAPGALVLLLAPTAGHAGERPRTAGGLGRRGNLWDRRDIHRFLRIRTRVRLVCPQVSPGFLPSSFSPIAFEQHSFVAPSRIGDTCQSAPLRFNMYVQLFAGCNFVGIV
jgi:hypothetical protein